MKRVLSVVAVAVLVVSACGGCAERYDCDVCVYGGTSAGVIAAYSASRLGKSVLLVEPGRRLGGMSSGGLGQTDIGNKQVVKGLALDFYRRAGRHYGSLEHWIFEPSVAEAIFKDYVARGGVDVLYDHRILKVGKRGAHIESIRLENTGRTFGRAEVRAREFIDCSYEGDLMARAGVSYTVGRESNEVYGETWNGVHVRPTHQFPDGVDPYKVKGDPASGLLWGISDEELSAEGSGDDKVQAYNYRLCLTNRVENMIPIERPADYDSTRYELLVRLMEAKGDDNIHSYLHFGFMPEGKTDINNNGGFSTDMIGMNHSYPEASYRERERIVAAHKSYTTGLLWFLGHDGRVPARIRESMLRWGLPKDEYVEYGHWTPQLYIRESRRMIGEYVATQADCENRVAVDDGVGMAAYTMDSHNCRRIVVVKDGKAMVKNEGDVQIHGGRPYDISYRSITPKREECDNLLVPVCLSASHIAYGSIRMEPVFMLLGQSAAKAACLAIDGGLKVQEIDAGEIRRMYREDPLLDGSEPDIVVDDTDVEADPESGWRRVNAGDGYGRSYYLLDPVKGKAVLSYPFSVRHDGRHAVYAYHIRRAASSRVTELAVRSERFTQRAVLDSDKIEVKGQTSGEWVSLGEYDLRGGETCYVDFTNDGDVTGQICADAILVVRVR